MAPPRCPFQGPSSSRRGPLSGTLPRGPLQGFLSRGPLLVVPFKGSSPGGPLQEDPFRGSPLWVSYI